MSTKFPMRLIHHQKHILDLRQIFKFTLNKTINEKHELFPQILISFRIKSKLDENKNI